MTKELTPSQKAAITNKAKYGPDYYKNIRSKVKNPGLGAIADPELRRQKASDLAKLRWRKHNEKNSPKKTQQDTPS